MVAMTLGAATMVLATTATMTTTTTPTTTPTMTPTVTRTIAPGTMPTKESSTVPGRKMQMDELNQIKQVLETALLTSTEPLSPAQMGKLFDPALSIDVVRRMLDELAGDWTGRGVELRQIAS